MTINLDLQAPEPAQEPTHQENWWGTQRCRRCNPEGAEARAREDYEICWDCDGSGWTVWAAMALEPWTEIVPNLWMGGHDYNQSTTGGQDIVSKNPENVFRVVVSLYRRPEFDPSNGTVHHVLTFADSGLDTSIITKAQQGAMVAADSVRDGNKTLVRCQAGLNRSGLVTGLALRELGYTSREAVTMMQTKRSPWVLCNEHYEAHLLGLDN